MGPPRYVVVFQLAKVGLDLPLGAIVYAVLLRLSIENGQVKARRSRYQSSIHFAFMLAERGGAAIPSPGMGSVGDERIVTFRAPPSSNSSWVDCRNALCYETLFTIGKWPDLLGDERYGMCLEVNCEFGISLGRDSGNSCQSGHC